ncbi:hypothetical protein [Streptomyces sp. NPDC101132]|uniref:hypothetical protein n=1 Tax=Streptomyces sp. NPDC101132 TaxID=3366110 RepID=UPI00382B268D
MSIGEGQVPGRVSTSPDWDAMADAHAAGRRRRKRLLWGGGGFLAAAVVAAVVATLVVTGGTSGDAPDAEGGPGAAPTQKHDPAADAMPDFADTTDSPDPLAYLSDARKDTAPLRAGLLFGTKDVKVGDHRYDLSGGDTTPDCTKRVDPALGAVLRKQGCTLFMRAAYSRDDAQVTVGVAVFPTAAQATAAKAGVSGGVTALPASAAKPFCAPGTVCRRTANSYGRYLYLTLTGLTGNKDASEGDQTVVGTGDDLAEYTFQRIVHRGRAAAEAAGKKG